MFAPCFFLGGGWTGPAGLGGLAVTCRDIPPSASGCSSKTTCSLVAMESPRAWTVWAAHGAVLTVVVAMVIDKLRDLKSLGQKIRLTFAQRFLKLLNLFLRNTRIFNPQIGFWNCDHSDNSSARFHTVPGKNSTSPSATPWPKLPPSIVAVTAER